MTRALFLWIDIYKGVSFYESKRQFVIIAVLVMCMSFSTVLVGCSSNEKKPESSASNKEQQATEKGASGSSDKSITVLVEGGVRPTRSPARQRKSSSKRPAMR